MMATMLFTNLVFIGIGLYYFVKPYAIERRIQKLSRPLIRSILGLAIVAIVVGLVFQYVSVTRLHEISLGAASANDGVDSQQALLHARLAKYDSSIQQHTVTKACVKTNMSLFKQMSPDTPQPVAELTSQVTCSCIIDFAQGTQQLKNAEEQISRGGDYADVADKTLVEIPGIQERLQACAK